MRNCIAVLGTCSLFLPVLTLGGVSELFLLSATCQNGVWELFVDGCLILMKGLLVLPQLEVAPESATMYGICLLRTFSLALFISSCFSFCSMLFPVVWFHVVLHSLFHVLQIV